MILQSSNRQLVMIKWLYWQLGSITTRRQDIHYHYMSGSVAHPPAPVIASAATTILVVGRHGVAAVVVVLVVLPFWWSVDTRWRPW